MRVLKLLLVGLLETSRRTKLVLQVVSEIFVLFSCFILAMYLRLENFDFLNNKTVWMAFAISLPFTIATFFYLGFYRAVIRYITSRAARAILSGTAVSAVSLYVISQSLRLDVPRSVPFIYALLVMVSVGGLRFIARSIFRWEKTRLKSPVLIYGAGSAGRQLRMSLQFGSEYDPVVFVDDSPDLQGCEVGGIPVHSPENLEHLIEAYGIQAILLAIPSATRTERNAILNRLTPLPVSVQTIPGIADLVSGREKTTQLREVSVEDLLGRDPVQPRIDLLDRNIRDKVVLVTGAGGSIGSELCRQTLAQKPRALILYEISEFALYSIDQDLRRIAQEKSLDATIVALLGSVRDGARLSGILRCYGVQTIYHAAAYKHVPLVEDNVVEGIENNVFGTRRVLEEAIAAGVESFIMISTDKAVRPTNIMGATKRMAELICQAQAHRQSAMLISMVRFGNVLGSSGSVIPLFRRQIERGGPITVTHPDITRYFMTIPEAAQLVIQAGGMARGGEVFVLDMGEPVKILDLAKRMARLSGLKAIVIDSSRQPTTSEQQCDIEIIITQLRPGEKLYEELLIDECSICTDHPRILAASETYLLWEELERLLDDLERACTDFSIADIRRLLESAPIGYAPASEIVERVWCSSNTSSSAAELIVAEA